MKMKRSLAIIVALSIILLSTSLFSKGIYESNVEALTGEINVFSDNFENGDSYGWDIMSGDWSVYDDSTTNRVFRQSTSTSGFLGLATSGNSDWEDYRLSVDVKAEDIANGGMILYFRYLDSNNHYLLYINSTMITLAKKVNGTQTGITAAYATIATGTTYTIDITVEGQQITCNLNSVNKISTTDTTFQKGKIGLGTWVAKAKFDNVAVYKVSQSFYVDDTLGNDANDGHSSNYPLKTLYKLSQNTFDPGDTIYLKKGEDWNESIQLKGSGSNEYPITITSYGTGNKPKLIGPYSYNDAVLYFENVSGWSINGLEIELSTTATLTASTSSDCGILFTFNAPTTFSNILIDNNFIHGNNIDRDTQGIIFSAGYDSSKNDEVVSGITISNNTISYIGWQAIATTTYLTSGSENISSSQIFNDIKILTNTVSYTANQGIVLGNANHSKIMWNTMNYGGQYTGTNAWGPGAIWPLCCSYVDIMFNEAAYMSDSNSGCDGMGFDIDWSNEFINLQYNYAHDNIGSGISTMSNINCIIQNNKLSGNYAATNGGSGQISISDYTVDGDVLSGVKNISVRDNIIKVNRNNTVGINTKKHTTGDAWAGNSLVNNRIVLDPNTSNNSVFNFDSNTVIDLSNYNTIYSQNASTFSATRFGTPYANLTLWQAIGYDQNSTLEFLDTSAPSTPSGISAAFNSSLGKVILSWSASSDNINHYNIYRSKDSTFTPAYSNMVGESTSLTFYDSLMLESDKSFYYKITAEDMNGNESAVPQSSTSVTTSTIVTSDNRIWQASSDFSSLLQGSTWYNQYRNGSTFTSITSFYPSWNVWRDGSTYLVLGGSVMSPDSREVVRTWVAPDTGTISINCSGNISVRDNTQSADGVDIKISKNTSTSIWPGDGSYHTVQYGNSHSFDAIQTYVRRGDSIHFVVNSRSNQYCDTTIWDPTITYVS